MQEVACSINSRIHRKRAPIDKALAPSLSFTASRRAIFPKKKKIYVCFKSHRS